MFLNKLESWAAKASNPVVQKLYSRGEFLDTTGEGAKTAGKVTLAYNIAKGIIVTSPATVASLAQGQTLDDVFSPPMDDHTLPTNLGQFSNSPTGYLHHYDVIMPNTTDQLYAQVDTSNLSPNIRIPNDGVLPVTPVDGEPGHYTVDVLVQTGPDDSTNDIIPVIFSDSPIDSIERMPESGIPKNYILGQNYPNPANPETTIEYKIPEPANVQFRIFDAKGARVRNLVDEHQTAGAYRLTWDGKDNNGQDVPSGMYFGYLQANGNRRTIKMVMLR